MNDTAGCAERSPGFTQNNVIKLVIDNDVLARYNEYYFALYPKRKKEPIAHPYHESINTWMIMKRAAMNALKQRWKDFIRWFVDEQGESGMIVDDDCKHLVRLTLECRVGCKVPKTELYIRILDNAEDKESKNG